MAVHRVTRILPYAPEQLAALVADVRAYPDFVPWITSMRVWNVRDEAPGVHLLDAEAGVGFAFLTEKFSTWVRHDVHAPKVEVGLIRGPFKHLKNRWEFFPHPEGTRLEFMIDFAFKSRMLDMMLFQLSPGRLPRKLRHDTSNLIIVKRCRFTRSHE